MVSADFFFPLNGTYFLDASEVFVQHWIFGSDNVVTLGTSSPPHLPECASVVVLVAAGCPCCAQSQPRCERNVFPGLS